MRKSRVDTAETRKRIVDVASHQFVAHGIAATGISDVMAAAGLTAGGFYRHFASKEQLLAEAVTAAFDRLFAMFQTVMVENPPREGLEIVIARYVYQTQIPDAVFLCPMAHLGSELRIADESVKWAASDGYRRFVQWLAVWTRQLDIPEPESTADAVVSTLVGAVTLARVTPRDDDRERLLHNAHLTVRRLLQLGELSMREGISLTGQKTPGSTRSATEPAR